MHMMAQYINSLEGDRKTLGAQVKRLASENNWLRKELEQHQQQLQETEVQLSRVKEEKQQLEFMTRNQKVCGGGCMCMGVCVCVCVCVCVWVCGCMCGRVNVCGCVCVPFAN